jgi:AcrR family transcriptional regulator
MSLAPELTEQHKRSTTRGATTFDRVLGVVCEILDRGGESSVRLAEVSELSGASMGSIYHHFGSREGLVAAARERQFRSSLSYRGQTDARTFLASSTPEEFIRRFDESLQVSEDADVAAGRRRRFELIGAAASRPESLPGVVALESAYLNAGEEIGQVLHDRGWLRRGVEPRAFALFLHSMSMVRVVRELDDSVSIDAWRVLVRRALEGMLAVELVDD